MKLDEIIQQPGQLNRLQQEGTLQRIHVALPARVISVDMNKYTVDVQPVIREWHGKKTPPQLVGVPVYFPGNFTYTINAGDECLVIFADTCIDGWWQTGDVSDPMVGRFHDLSDGFAIVGFRSKNRIPSEAVNLDQKIAELEQRIAALEEEE